MRFIVLALMLASILITGPAQAKIPKTEVLAIGDSITQGGGTNNPYSDAYPAVAGVDALGYGGSCALRASCEKSGGVYIMDWLPEALASKPKPRMVVIHMGMNDLPWARPGELIKGLKQLKQYFRAQGIRPVLATITPPPASKYWLNNTRIPVNNWIRKKAHVEYARPLENKNMFLKPKYYSAEKDIHPGTAGARVMGRKLARYLATH